MFKNKAIVLLGSLTLLLVSCGGKNLCDCKTMLFDHWEDMVAHRKGENPNFMDEEKIQIREVEKKECESILESYDKEMESKTEAERADYEEALLEKCGLTDRL